MNKFYTIMAASALLSLSACSGTKEPTFGEMVKLETGAAQGIGEQWEKGDALVQKGVKIQKDGEDDINKARKLDKKGQNKVEEGQDLIAKGKAIKSKAENQYHVLNTPPAVQTNVITPNAPSIYEPR